MRNRSLGAVVIVAALVFGASGVLYAQIGTDVSKGSVSVDVLDPTGAIIQNANIRLSGAAGEQRAVSDLRGQAVFYNLIPGTYRLRVEQPGFRTFEVQNIVVRANQRTPVVARLEPGAVTEVVQVTGTASQVDTTTTTTGTNLAQDTFVNLPLGRNINSLFQLAPGAAPSGDPVLQGNPSISGATGLENQYIIDGINTTDVGYGAFGVFSNVYGSLGTGVNFDFVREVQVKTGGFEAQYGQALGGIVNVVTSSGTNEIHGALYGYSSPGWAESEYRQPNEGFDGFAPRVSNPQTEFHGRNGWDAGFNIGGPLMRDRFFWYGAFNPSFKSTQRLAPANFGAREFGIQTWKTRTFNWVGKLNYNLTDNHHLEGTAFGDPSREPNGVHRALLRDDLEAQSKNEYGTRNWAVKYNGVFGANTLLNAWFGWNHTYFVETPTVNTFSIRNYAKPKPNAAYTLEGGVGFLENNDGNNRQYNAMMTRNLTVLGGHQFDIGYGFNQVQYDAIRLYSGPDWALPAVRGVAPEDVGRMVHGGLFYFYPTRTVGSETFSNVFRQVRGNFSEPRIATETDYHSAFVQDAWQINRYITAKLGVRWEQQEINGNLNTYTFAGNWAPRLGFIIDPTGSRKTKLFANWGRFFEKIPQDLAVRSMSEESSYFNIHSFAIPPTAANLAPGTVAAPSGTHPTVIFGGTKSMYQEEVAAGVERELTEGFVVSARFLYRDLKRLLEDISGVTVEAFNAGIEQQYVISNPNARLDIFHNPRECTGGADCNPETGFTFDTGLLGPDGQPDLFPDARRVYRALELTAEKRFSRNWSILANYRLAKLHGNYEGLFRNDNGQSDPNITSLFDFILSPALADQFAVGVLPTDRRHIANIYGNYLFANRFNVGLGWQVLSGTPITKFLSHPGYINAGEIPQGGRGAFGRTPTENYFDLRLDYQVPLAAERVRMKLGANLFNVFNRRTVTAVDQDFELSGAVPNEDFLKPLRVHRPFYASFNVRFEF